jgi:hypothetical protein
VASRRRPLRASPSSHAREGAGLSRPPGRGRGPSDSCPQGGKSTRPSACTHTHPRARVMHAHLLSRPAGHSRTTCKISADPPRPRLAGLHRYNNACTRYNMPGLEVRGSREPCGGGRCMHEGRQDQRHAPTARRPPAPRPSPPPPPRPVPAPQSPQIPEPGSVRYASAVERLRPEDADVCDIDLAQRRWLSCAPQMASTTVLVAARACEQAHDRCLSAWVVRVLRACAPRSPRRVGRRGSPHGSPAVPRGPPSAE